jgi:hypothetical protein
MTVPDVAPYDGHSKPVPKRAAKLAGARRGYRRAPLFSRQPAYKPGSGRHANVFRMRDGHSSGTPVARRLKQPTRTAGSGPIQKQVRTHRLAPSLFGLAPGGVCPAAGVTASAVRSYRTFSPLPRPTQHAAAVCFLWHCPWVRTRRMLSGTACPRSPDFPLRQPFGYAGAAVRPTDENRDGHAGRARQVTRPIGAA